MSAEYPGAGWVPCPGFGFPLGAHGRNGQTARWIILHGTASGDGTAQQQAQFFSGATDHGVHFVIGKDGAVIQLVALADAAYGNGGPTDQELAVHAYDHLWDAEIASGVNLNLVTVSIEHCKTASDNSDVLTPAQQDASFKLVAWLCKTLNIPPRRADSNGGITGHFAINGIERIHCPGLYPWDALWNSLGGSTAGTGGDGLALIQHPTQEMRLDIVYIGADGNLYHRWTIDGGMQGIIGDSTTTGDESWGNPGKPFAPLTVSATWDAQGGYLNVIAATTDGALWGQVRQFSQGVTTPGSWTQISPVQMQPLALSKLV